MPAIASPQLPGFSGYRSRVLMTCDNAAAPTTAIVSVAASSAFWRCSSPPNTTSYRRQRVLHDLADRHHLALGEKRMHRQGEHAVSHRLGVRKVSTLVSKSTTCRLQMKRNRVMNPAFDLFAQKRCPDHVATIAADDEQVVTRLAPVGFGTQVQAVAGQSLAINRCESPALRVPFLQALELGTQHRRLKSVEPRVVSVRAVGVVRQPA